MFTSCKQEKKSKEKVLVFNNLAEPASLDPAIIEGNVESELVLNLFEGLTAYNPETLKANPGVAESWEMSQDGLTYTFKLRQNVKWSDGTPITAETFKYSWLRALKPELASTYAYQLYYIKNAQQYNEGKGKPEDVGVKVIDDYTLQVTLESPTPFFLDLMSFSTYSPVPKHVIEKVGEDKWYLPENIVCNGPFKLIEWKPQQEIVMVKNDTYWDKDKVKLDKVIALPIEDNNTAVEKYLNKEIDWSRDINDERIDELKRMKDMKIAPAFITYFYRVNVTNSTVADVKVRKALSMAIERSKITDYILKGGQKPALSYVPPIFGYNSSLSEKENINKAKQYLTEAGYPDGKGFPKLTLLYNTSENHKKIAEAVQQMWKTNLNIDIELENAEWKVYLDKQTKLDYQICRAGWQGDYVDPNTFLDMFTSYSGQNNTGWANPDYDRFIQEASKEANTKVRYNLLSSAEKILMEELPIIPVYFYVTKNLVRDNIIGYYDNVLDQHPLKEVDLK